LPREQAGERVAIVLDLRQHDEAERQQRQRKRRETDDDDGPEKADQRKGDRAGTRRMARGEGIMEPPPYCSGSREASLDEKVAADAPAGRFPE
jgi:hypothetical protein